MAEIHGRRTAGGQGLKPILQSAISTTKYTVSQNECIVKKKHMVVLDLMPIEGGFLLNDLQKINSAYTKTNNPAGFIASSGVLYADKNKTTQLLRVLGFQLPGTQQRSGSIGSISYVDDDVKIQSVPFARF